MAKIYYDPDTDELIPVSKSKSPSEKTASSADADDISKRLDRIESELKSLNRKTDEVRSEMADSCFESGRSCGDFESGFSEGYAAGYRSSSGSESDQIAFALGAVAGWKLVDDVCDSVKDAFDFRDNCGCGKKKKWF